MATPDIPTIFARLVEHPLRELPYSAIRFVRLDHNGRPIYAVEHRDGTLGPPQGAKNVLEAAAREWGARCFYHRDDCADNPGRELVAKRQRDHVVPTSGQGRDDLHNLVLCC